MPDPLAIPRAFLQQALQPDLPLATRLRTLGKLARSIDEYLRSRSVKPAGDDRNTKADIAAVASLLDAATTLMRNQFMPLLLLEHIHISPVEQLGEQQQDWLHTYFLTRIYPLLTPLAVDPGHPFPYISSDSLNLLVLLRLPGRPGVRTRYARLKIPRQLVPRLIDVPPLAKVDSPVLHHDVNEHYWVWSEDVVRFFVHELFPGMSVTGIYQFRVLRGAATNEAHGAAFSEADRGKSAPVVRLDVARDMPPAVVQWLATRLEAPPERILRCQLPLGMADWDYLGQRLAELRQYV